MENYKLSRAASNDIVSIYKFGIKTFGLEPAKEYLISLESFLEELARDSSIFARNLNYYRFKSNVIFYVFNESNKIFVIRILGKRMDFVQHL